MMVSHSQSSAPTSTVDEINNQNSTLDVRSAIISLKFHSGSVNFAEDLEENIKYRGGICLTDNQDKTGFWYVGIAVIKEKFGQSEKWFLHLCPGYNGDGRCFTLQDFDNLMPIAIQKLEELKIIPEYASLNYGTHCEIGTLENFYAWQKKQPH